MEKAMLGSMCDKCKGKSRGWKKPPFRMFRVNH